jgi:ABC-2 type transport system permease protein
MSETRPRAPLIESQQTGEPSHPLVQLTLMRIREFIREPEAVFWAMFFPILLTSGLGIAFRSHPTEVLKVATPDAAIARALRQEPALDVTETDSTSAQTALRTGKVALIATKDGDGTVFHYDDTNPEGRTARMLADRAIQRGAGRTDPVVIRDDVAREAGSRYVDFLVPGLVGLGIMSNAVWGLGFSIVDSRRRKLLKRLVATPMSRTYYLMSYLVWRMILLVVEIAVPIGFGVLAFGVPVRGHVWELVFICWLASMSFSALGLLVASRAKTIEAVSGLMNLIQIPMWILSGLFFSAQRFPAMVQPFIQALPLTAANDALRSNMLQGTPISQLGPQLAVLAIWLVVSFVLALKLFRWR